MTHQARHTGTDATRYDPTRSTHRDRGDVLGLHKDDIELEDSNIDETPSKGLRQQAAIHQSKRAEYDQWSKFQAEKRMEFDQWLKLHDEKEEASKNKQVGGTNGATNGS
jgi:hypothetical protein